MLEAEVALMLIAAGLYLYDSALLLYGDEGVICAVGGNGWAVRFGSGIRIRGRDLFIPSPLLPHRPLFRLVWNTEGRGVAAEARWTERRALFKPLAPFVWGILGSLFVLLPLGLFSRLGDAMVLAAVAVLYLNIVVLLGWLALKRAMFGVTRARLARLAFEALICSPLALNLVRKISAEMPVDEDLVHAARRLQTAEDWQASRKEIIARIEEELDFAAEESRHAAALKTLKEELARDDRQ
jgi:hypothetical protein